MIFIIMLHITGEQSLVILLNVEWLVHIIYITVTLGQVPGQ